MVYRVGQVKALTRRRESSGNPWKIQRSPIEPSQWLAIISSNKKVFRKFFLFIDPMIANRNKCGLRFSVGIELSFDMYVPIHLRRINQVTQ